MEHVTACYWQKETPAELFLSLQQRKYRRLGISVVCACISDNGELVRSLQNKMEEELEGENVWRPFREEILQEKWMDIIRQQKQGAENNRKYGQIIKGTWLSGSGICGQGEFREGLPRPGRKKGLSGM